jgi:penicillin-binding protein 1C
MLGVLFGLDYVYPLKQQRSFSTVVVASNGEVLRAFSNARQQWRYPIANDQVPNHYKTLLLGYEDRWFYWHFGVNPLSILRAAWQNLSAGTVVSGGSTLTMQVARLLHPHKKSVSGKLQQMLRALQLEWHLSKSQILNLYLNLAPFGGTLIGVQAASISYFDKPLNQLSDAEAALLAVLPQAPSRWRPDRHPKAAKSARNKVLKRMAELKIWPLQRVEDAIAEPIFSMRQNAPLNAPLLTRRLKQQCKHCEKIDTFIDINMQRQLEELVTDYSQGLAQGVSVAVLAMENKTGKVRSYIGSAGFLNQARFGHVDMIQAVRSPGSTLKPFLYGLAIDEGLIHSQSLLQDTPRYKKAYRPRNFSGGFNGPISVTQALQRSLNIPAVQVLEKLQADNFAAKLEFSGLKLSGVGAKNPNASMILGGVGTTLQSLLSSYSALARSGITIKPRYTDQDPVVERYLLSPGAAWITWKMLAVKPNKLSRSRRFDNDWPLAWKTGTSYGHREAWAMGVSENWSLGVWVGRPDASASVGLSGRASAAPLLFKVYRAIARDDLLEKPASVTRETICWPLGTLISDVQNTSNNCQQKHVAWVLDKTTPRTLSDRALLKTIWRNNSGDRVDPSCDSGHITKQMVAFWPQAIEPWLLDDKRSAYQLQGASQACQHLQMEQTVIKITSVPDNSYYQQDEKALKLQLKAQGGSGKNSWYLDGRFIGASVAAKSIDITIKASAKYQLSVVDEQGNTDMVSFTIQ